MCQPVGCDGYGSKTSRQAVSRSFLLWASISSTGARWRTPYFVLTMPAAAARVPRFDYPKVDSKSVDFI